MPELTESKPSDKPLGTNKKLRITFLLRPAGIGILFVIIPAFISGAMRRELSLTLLGTVFLALWVYCLLMTLFLALLHRRRTRRASIRVSPREISTGETVQTVYSEGNTAEPDKKIFQLPGILIRCRLLLSTKDGRIIKEDFFPEYSTAHSFTAKKRGAYFSLAGDEFAVFDILGFFRFAFRLKAENDARLLVSPRAADEPPSVNARAGDSSLKPEFSFQRTDNLIDHRPYIPGDDPRRINWKLYGHGGGLFVREGEREPPPHSNIIILIDTEYDPLLYSAPAARRGIDLLCENALAAAVACTESGMDVIVGFSGGAVHGGNARELASALALPAALSHTASAPPELPVTPDDRGIIILALPRTNMEDSTIDRFLKKITDKQAGNETPRRVNIIFFCGDSTDDNGNSSAASPVYGKRFAAAAACAVLYSRRPGVTARTAGV